MRPPPPVGPAFLRPPPPPGDSTLLYALAVTCFRVAPLVTERYRPLIVDGITLVAALFGPDTPACWRAARPSTRSATSASSPRCFRRPLEECRDDRPRIAGSALPPFRVPQADRTAVAVPSAQPRSRRRCSSPPSPPPTRCRRSRSSPASARVLSGRQRRALRLVSLRRRGRVRRRLRRRPRARNGGWVTTKVI